MPWNNQSNGGGGPWGGGNNNNGGGGNNNGGSGGNGGPWGQGPNRPSGPQGTPPDLEDIIRRGQDRLRRALPGGGRGNNAGGGSGLGSGSPALFGLIAVVVLVFWAFQSVYTVQPDEVAVELRFGKPKAELSEPGLHFHWWPIETVEVANIAEKLVNIGEARGGQNSSGLMLSGDQNIVDVRFSVAYQVSDPISYLFKVADPDEMVRQVAESAMREAVGRRPAQDIFRDDRQGIAEAVRGIIQGTLDQYQAGINVNAISIEDAAPPREVADAFDEVQRAEQDEDRFVEESNQYSNQKLGQARGQAAQLREEAAAYKNRVVQEAQGEAQRFVSVYDQYALAPEVTRQRLFLETMERVLRNSNKVIVEQGASSNGSGVVPYLPLPQLQNRPAEEAPPQPTYNNNQATGGSN
ncbi:FtsH protease activity modulator HflK [Tianweitania sp. BSSL-BM11]|uniref:Protein HflK n=1 Tax=Tianweitania aestuarii TaxID=2814886 RepID=A0ABS5RUZ9_9HYPH|nr:FtsH protease activity modulator HflK [Tianweitania aestuarii]MBS9720876.1 FtsH protease activity modulator HflK [Tianweitania aestuarii]